MTKTQQDVHLITLQQAVAQQQVAWHAQAQAVAAQTQVLSDLITQHREWQYLLDERYRYVLAQTFWLRDSQPLNATLLLDVLIGANVTATRLRRLLQSELARLRSGFSSSLALWILLPVTSVLLPWLAARVRRRLRANVDVYITLDAASDNFGAKAAAVGLMLLQTMIWPLYIVLLVWAWSSFFPGVSQQPPLQRALSNGFAWMAFLLWLDLLAQAIVRRGGWGERYLGLPREPGQAIRRTISIGCLAALFGVDVQSVLKVAV